MRIFTNERFLKRRRQFATILFFLSLLILVGGLVLTNTVPRSNYLLMTLPLLAMPVGLVTTWISVRLTNLYVRAPHAEDALQIALKGVSHHSVLYNYLFKATHVLVGSQGVFAIVTRFQEGRFTVEGERVRSSKARGPLGMALVFLRQEQLGNPVKDAQDAAADLQKQLDGALPGLGINVQPVVVFIGPRAELDTEQMETVPVVLANPKSKQSLKLLLREGKKRANTTLSIAQIDRIEAALNNILGIGETQSQVVAEE